LSRFSLGNILNIIDLEQPDVVIYLVIDIICTKQVKTKFKNLEYSCFAARTKKLPHTIQKHATTAVDLFIEGDEVLPVTTISFVGKDQMTDLRFINDYKEPMDNWQTDEAKLIADASKNIDTHEWQGLVQVLYNTTGDSNYEMTGIRPVRITETAFLTKITGINWINVLVRKYLGKLDLDSLKDDLKPTEHQRSAIMTAHFPFRELQVWSAR